MQGDAAATARITHGNEWNNLFMTPNYITYRIFGMMFSITTI
jgi:hypothetical protein